VLQAGSQFSSPRKIERDAIVRGGGREGMYVMEFSGNA